MFASQKGKLGQNRPDSRPVSHRHNTDRRRLSVERRIYLSNQHVRHAGKGELARHPLQNRFVLD
jgi:hypothetical protein